MAAEFEWESESLGQTWDPGYYACGPAGYGGPMCYQFGQGPYVDSVYTTRVGPIAGTPDVDVQCDSENSTRIRISPSTSPSKLCNSTSYTYSVKIVNPDRKSNYTMKKLPTNSPFTSIEDLQRQLSSLVGTSVDHIGYIQPGHGLRGKQQWLCSNGDRKEMYQCYKNRRDILLWCHGQSDIKSVSHPLQPRKRGANDATTSEDKPPSKRTSSSTACAQKIKDVEDNVKQLEEKHGPKYSVEQFNAWAHMINLKKHTSFDNPPNLPYFRGYKKVSPQSPDNDDHGTQLTAVTVSPGKRISHCSECINQLDKWHALYEKGAISKERYDELQCAILKDILP